MRYDEIVDLLLRKFPALVPGYEKMASRHKAINESPDAHVVYGNLFCDYMIVTAQRDNPDLGELKRIGNWIEELAGSEDAEVRYVVEVSILERLVDEHVDAFIPFLGPNSVRLVHDIGERLHLDEKTWGRL